MSAYDQADLDAVNQLIATGAKRIKYQDRELEYTSPNQLRQLRNEIMRCLGLAGKGRRFTLSAPKKGLG